MSPVRKASTVDGIRRGAGTANSPTSTPMERGFEVEHGAPAREPKPVRMTLDLDQATHRMLRDFAADSGAGVSAAKVLRALLAELAEGPNLAARIRARIWQP